jgi:hypothetical protein
MALKTGRDRKKPLMTYNISENMRQIAIKSKLHEV